MNIFQDITAGLSKATSFLITVVTKTPLIAAQIAKLSPSVIAAMLAVFYDVVKAALAAESAVASAQTGNVLNTITLSQTTMTLVQSVVKDAKDAEELIVTDLKALGIVKE